MQRYGEVHLRIERLDRTAAEGHCLDSEIRTQTETQICFLTSADTQALEGVEVSLDKQGRARHTDSAAACTYLYRTMWRPGVYLT